MMDVVGGLGVLVVAGLIFLLILGIFVKGLLVLSSPNEVVVLSGRKHRTPEGETVGYRWFKGGRALRWPLLEKVDRLNLNAMNLEVGVPGAITKGGIRINIQAIANVKIHGEMPFMGNALERLLGKSEDNIRQIAREQLEANLRGAASALTPEEINEDRTRFAEELSNEADSDLNKLGFDLDTLKVQDVSDDKGYLEAIGRRRASEVVRDAEIAESAARKEAENVKAQNAALIEIQQAQADADARTEKAALNQKSQIAEAQAKAATEVEMAQREADAEMAQARAHAEARSERAVQDQKAQIAETQAKAATEMEQAQREADAGEMAATSQQRSQVAQAQAQQAITEAQGALRIKKAQADGAAQAAENEATEQANLARVQAQKDVESERLELQRQKLQVDVVEPAEAAKKSAELDAAGQVAAQREAGQLEVELLRRQRQVIEEGGAAGERLLIINMLPELVKPMVEAAAAGKPDSVVILGQSNGEAQGASGGVENTMLQVYRDLLMFGPMYQAAIKDMTGIDIPQVLHPTAGTENQAPATNGAPVDQGPAEPAPDKA